MANASPRPPAREPDSSSQRVARAASGWSVRLFLVLGIVPFALGLVDLLVRVRRRRLPLAPAVRALRTRLGLALLAGALVWLGALVGVFPTGAALPLPPYADIVALPPITGLLALGAVFVAGWLVARRRLRPRATTSDRSAHRARVACARRRRDRPALNLRAPSCCRPHAWPGPAEGAHGNELSFVVGLTGPVALPSRELGTSPSKPLATSRPHRGYAAGRLAAWDGCSAAVGLPSRRAAGGGTAVAFRRAQTRMNEPGPGQPPVPRDGNEVRRQPTIMWTPGRRLPRAPRRPASHAPRGRTVALRVAPEFGNQTPWQVVAPERAPAARAGRPDEDEGADEDDTGLPGRPKTSVSPRTPNASSGLTATPQTSRREVGRGPANEVVRPHRDAS